MATSDPSTPTAIAWFRRDLRLEHQPAWDAATEAGDRVVALYVLDPVALATAGPARRDLLHGHLRALDADLRLLGGGLLIRTGDPVRIVPDVARSLGGASVHANADVSGYAQRRDRAVADALAPAATLELRWGSHVHPPGDVVAASTGRTHRVFSAFSRAWSAASARPWPTGGGAEVVDPRDLPASVGAEGVPEPAAEPVMEPGADAAAARLADWLDEVDGYPDRRDRPDDPTGTSHLSADLRWGTLAPRHVVDVVGTSTPGREAFVRQLAWRDWYAHLVFEEPRLARHALTPEMDRVRWRDDPDGLAAWRDGRTGYPIVDAGMRELAATGWMHNRVRMVVASFLVKDLLVDWRAGEAHFRRLLVDWELSQNVGNWQWVAGTGPDAAPYFRVFNPVAQGRRFDPEGTYVHRWVPELAGLAAPAVHAPWEVPPLELAAAGIVLGADYPHPIVGHGPARERALAAYAAARGGDPGA